MQVYYAVEDSDECARCCFNNNRAFDMLILDNHGKEVIHLYRPLELCCPDLNQSIQVFSPPGVLIGSIEQEVALSPSFNVRNESDRVILRIKGPFITMSLGNDVDFKVNMLTKLT